jgi:hypothetical protein
MQRALPRRTLEKARNTLVLYRAQRLGERRLVRRKQVVPDGRTSVAGDDFEIPVGIFEAINGDLDAVAAREKIDA